MGGRVRRWQAATWQGTARKNFSNYVHFVAKTRVLNHIIFSS